MYLSLRFRLALVSMDMSYTSFHDNIHPTSTVSHNSIHLTTREVLERQMLVQFGGKFF